MCMTSEEARKYAALLNAGVAPSEAFRRALNPDAFPVTPAALDELAEPGPSDTAEPISAAGERSLGDDRGLAPIGG